MRGISHDLAFSTNMTGFIVKFNMSSQTLDDLGKLKCVIAKIFSEQHQIRRKQVPTKTNSFMNESFENILNPTKLSTFVLSLFIEIVCIIISTEMIKKMIASYAS